MSVLTLSPKNVSALHRVFPHSPPSELRSPSDRSTVAPRQERSAYFTAQSFKRPATLARPNGASSCAGVTNTAALDSLPLREPRMERDVWELSDNEAGVPAVPTGAMDSGPVTTARVAEVKSRMMRGAQATTKTRANTKTKAKENLAPVQGTIEGPKITKPRAKKSSSKSLNPTQKSRSTSIDEPLGLEMGVARRMDWTPPKSRTHSIIDLIDDPEGNEDGDAASVQVCRYNSFQGLLGDYNYSPPSAEMAEGRQQRGAVSQPPPTKRRKLNCIESSVQSRPLAAVTKKDVKAPKKKARTITAQATRDFMPIDEALDGESSLMDNFLTQQQPQADDAGLVSATDTTRGRRKSKARPKPKGPPPSRLLAPELAIHAVESQELLFGTSSQLVREDSPSFIRDLQVALRESEAGTTRPNAEEDLIGSLRESSRGQLGTKGKSLWAAARRDLEGGMLEPELIDLSKTPQATSRRTSGFGSGVAGLTGSTTGPLTATQARFEPVIPASPLETHRNGDGGVDASILELDRDSLQSMLPSHTHPVLTLDHADSTTCLPKSMAEAACRMRPRSKSPVKKAPRKSNEKVASKSNTGPGDATPAPKAKVGRKAKADADTQTPSKETKSKETKKTKDQNDFNNWTIPELTKKIKSYGFKAVKGKSVMVALLEKCRESQGQREETEKGKDEGRVASAHFETDSVAATTGDKAKTKKTAKAKAKAKLTNPEDPATVNGAEVAPTAPKKRGRPRKNTADTATDPLPPTPGSKAIAKPDSSSKSPTTSGPTLTVGATAPITTESALLAAITAAVTRFPPTHDPANLSWHERILMYDPIVLEDLTIWLNTVGLGAVGVDEEVWPGLVRTWCEERSVCCLWKENLRGGKRARF